MARDTRKHEDNRRFDLVVARETDDGKGGTARRDAALFRLLDWPDYPTVSGSLTQAALRAEVRWPSGCKALAVIKAARESGRTLREGSHDPTLRSYAI